MPFPSRGCRTCRQRRVKCDETRPECDRCTRSHRECGGYDQDKGAPTFRSENDCAAGTARRPRRRRVLADDGIATPNQQDQDRSLTRSSTSSLYVTTADRTPPSIVPGISINLEDQAVVEYLHRHIDCSGSMPTSIWPLLGTLSLQTRADTSNVQTVFSLAFSASSLAFLARSRAMPAAMVLAENKYIRALTKLNAIIGDAEHATSDEVLLAVMLMGNYEGIVCDFDSERLFLTQFHHMDGAIALLKLRQEHKHRGHFDQSIDRHIRRQTIRQSIYRGTSIPPWLQSGEAFGENGPELALDICLVKVSVLRHQGIEMVQRLTRAPGNTSHLEYDLESLLLEAQELDSLLIAWTFTAPCECRPGIHQCEVIDTAYQEASLGVRSSTDDSIARITLWNRYRGGRLVVNCIIEKVTNCIIRMRSGTMALDAQAHIDDVRALQRILVDAICASVPRIMDDVESPASAVRAFVLSWPLTIAVAVPGISDSQRQWIRLKLKLISGITTCGTFGKLAAIDLHNRKSPIAVATPYVTPERQYAMA